MNESKAIDFHENHDQGNTGDFLREFVYGGIDGGITTFAVVAGATGAQFDISVIIILGIANLIADGFSMSVGSYLSIKAQHEKYRKFQQYEKWGVENIPEAERGEIREIYRAKGLKGQLLERIVDVITYDKDLWVDEMMKGEFQLVPEKISPLRAGFYTFLSFISIGSIPLLPFIILYLGWAFPASPFLITGVLTSLTFVFIGLVKSKINHTRIGWAVFETLLLGSVAALLAYSIGSLLESLITN